MGYSTDLTNKQWEMIETVFKNNKEQYLSTKSLNVI